MCIAAMTLSYQITSKAELTPPDTADKDKGARSQAANLEALVRQIVQDNGVAPADRSKKSKFLYYIEAFHMQP